MTKKTYSGTCQCRAIRFEVDLDLQAGTSRCNCTVCTKLAWWGAIARPADFRLLAGEEVLGSYTKHPEIGQARFCARCGVRTHGHGTLEVLGGDFVSINLRVLDDVDLTGVKVDYLDGLHDTWEVLRSAPHASEFAPG